jgi:hypothetical protein
MGTNEMKNQFMNFEIEQSEEEINGQIWHIARCNKIAPKSRMGYKAIFAYRFRTMDEMTKYINDFMATKTDYKIMKELEKTAKSEAKKNLINPFKVGDILVNSWGWEQTNIDFFQIVKVGPKSVTYREIGSDLTHSDGLSSMAGYVMARRDYFIGDEVTKVLQCYGIGEKLTIYVPCKHGSISLWDGEKEYCSWYA